MPTTKLVMCRSAMTEEFIQIPADQIEPRPSAYVDIRNPLNRREILMIRSALTGRYFLPGGGIEQDEDPEQALSREVREETGRRCINLCFWQAFENHVYADFEGTEWHAKHPEYTNTAWRVEMSVYFGDLEGEGSELAAHDPDEGAPQWVDIDNVRKHELQDIAKEIVPRLRELRR